jgi:hypothetical protein
VLVGPRAGNPDTWAENEGRSPSTAFKKPKNCNFIGDLSPPSTSIRYGMNTAGESVLPSLYW